MLTITVTLEISYNSRLQGVREIKSNNRPLPVFNFADKAKLDNNWIVGSLEFRAVSPVLSLICTFAPG